MEKEAIETKNIEGFWRVVRRGIDLMQKKMKSVTTENGMGSINYREKECLLCYKGRENLVQEVPLSRNHSNFLANTVI